MAEPDSKHVSDDVFARIEAVKREEEREWFRNTTPGQRVDAALRLSRLAAELRAGVQTGGS